MRKYLTFNLIVAALIVATSCEKENITPNSTPSTPSTHLVTQQAGDSKSLTIADTGYVIPSSEASDRIAQWNLLAPSSYESSGSLSDNLYDTLKNVDGAVAISFAYGEDANIIAFAVDDGFNVLIDKIVALDSNGGTLIHDSLVTEIDNEDFPADLVIGVNLLDDLLDQTGAKGIKVLHALNEVGENNFLNMIFQAYNSSGGVFGNTGVTAYAGCRVWVPGYWIYPCLQCPGDPIWVNGHWRNCNKLEQAVYNWASQL